MHALAVLRREMQTATYQMLGIGSIGVC
jgi:hypothetical protein